MVTAMGTIEPGTLYRLDEFLIRSGMGRKAYDAAVRRGLKVKKCGKRVFIAGRDFIAFVENDADRRQAAAV